MTDARSGPRAHTTLPDDPTRVDTPSVAGLAGATLCDRYRLERLIGSGGMAQVWESTDEVLGRRVAVKVLHPHLSSDAALVARFRQEAVAAARLSHPGIVGVYDTCSDGVHEAIVMELLDASTLRQHLDEHGTLDAETSVRITLRLLDALEAAHRAGLVHRDVKPSNILLCRDGRVMIADFGIAKAEDQTELTQEGTLVGTASYLAPEQLLGGEVDARADLYALGIVLYECLTGRLPFRGDTGAATALARLHSDPVDPRRLRADIPARIATPLMRVLARDPDDRFDSTADLRAALLDTGISPSPAGATAPAPEHIDDDDVEQSFAHSERGWLVPALFILLIATAITVAGLLLRETAMGSEPATTTSSTPTPVTGVVPWSGAVAYDPQGRGRPGENDGAAQAAIDSDPATSWRTEAYDSATFFGAKTGVGLGLVVGAPTEALDLEISGSTNGWGGRVYVIPSGEYSDDRPLPTDLLDGLEPIAVLEDVRDTRTLELGGRNLQSGDLVMIWITGLGDNLDNGRHRVELAEVTLRGRPADG